MRQFLVAVAFLAGSAAIAQSPLQTNLIALNQGNAGGGLYFDLEVRSTVSITRIDTWVGNIGTSPGSLVLELWLGPATYVGNLTNPAVWAPAGTATATGYVPNPPNYQQMQFDFAAPVVLAPGLYGIALRSQPLSSPTQTPWNHAYSNGTQCSNFTIPGSCLNTVHSNAELTVRGGAAQNTFLTGAVFQPRMWSGSLYYTSGGAPVTLAAAAPFGSGCAGAIGLPALVPQMRPVLGQTFAASITNVAGSGLGFAVYGLSNTAWYYAPLPLDLGFVGLPGCRQYTDIVAVQTFVLGGGATSLQTAIPNDGGLQGQRFYAQALLPDPSAGLVVTNAVGALAGL
jgi:hypothetical protein